jgi:16S rRNA (guanine966-N2)-methyltransferase
MAKRQSPEKTHKHQASAPGPGRLRIVAGIWRSRVLEVADVPGLRPTAERVRETLFNWLTPEIIGKHCLDLYAGTGALGLEALSRGAGGVTLVESSPVALACLRRNVSKLGAREAKIEASDAITYLKRCAAQSFDVVFLDPPFGTGRLADLCALLKEKELLKSGAKVYLEQDRAAALPLLPGGWSVLKEKTAGNVRYALVATGTE